MKSNEEEREPKVLDDIEQLSEFEIFLHLFPFSFWSNILEFTNSNKRKLKVGGNDFTLHNLMLYLLFRFTMASNPKRKKLDYWSTDPVGLAPPFNFGKYMS